MFEEKHQAKLAEELRALAQSILENAHVSTTSFQPLNAEDYSFSVYHPYTLIQDDLPGHKFIAIPRPRTRLMPADKHREQAAAEAITAAAAPRAAQAEAVAAQTATNEASEETCLQSDCNWYDQIPADQFACKGRQNQEWVDSIPGNEFMLTFTSPQFDNIATTEFSVPAAVLQMAF